MTSLQPIYMTTQNNLMKLESSGALSQHFNTGRRGSEAGL